MVVSLAPLVPADNFYRHLEAKLDPNFVRAWTQERYAERGRPSIDLVVFFKLQLLLFFDGIFSERQLIATASLNLGPTRAPACVSSCAIDSPNPPYHR